MSGSAVIGLGNPLMGDDGFGLVALARLRDEWTLEGVELVDGGTWGMSLLPLIEDSDRVVLLDAIAAGATPGEIDRQPVALEHNDLTRPGASGNRVEQHNSIRILDEREE